MSHCVAGHTFNSLTHGEFCCGDNCEGVSSLVELCSQAPFIKPQDKGWSHVGGAIESEIRQALEAKKVLDAHMARMFG